MDHAAYSLRKYALIKVVTVICLVPLSAPAVASPADALNLWYPVANVLSDDEGNEVVKLGMSAATGYSDGGIEIEKETTTPIAKRNSRDHDFFKRNSISVHVGQTSMLDLEQSLDKVVGTECALWIFGCVYDRDITEPLPVTFKSTPSLAWSIEYEHHMRGLWSYGGEYYRSIHKYTASSLTPTDGELEINRMFFAIKKYFEMGESLQSYIGVSGGILQADMRGAISSSYNDGGSGWSGVIGAVYRISNVNFKVSYRYSESNIHIQDTFINDGLRRKTYGDISTRSSGYFAGMEVRF